MIRCFNCGKEVKLSIGETAYSDWLMLMHYFKHELDEGEISETTFESLADALMTFRPEDAKTTSKGK